MLEEVGEPMILIYRCNCMPLACLPGCTADVECEVCTETNRIRVLGIDLCRAGEVVASVDVCNLEQPIFAEVVAQLKRDKELREEIQRRVKA